MNLDLCKIYAFIRQDLPLGQETIQAIHAAFHAGMHFGAEYGLQDGIPYVVVTDTPSLKSVRKAQRKLEVSSIGHYAMTDTDVDDNVSAVVTFPVEQDKQEVLREYRLRNYVPAVVNPTALDGKAGANADVAQLREHPVCNGEVVGANPAISSNFNCS